MNLGSELIFKTNSSLTFSLEEFAYSKRRKISEWIEEEICFEFERDQLEFPDTIFLRQEVGKFFIKGNSQKHKLDLSFISQIEKKINFSSFIKGKTSILESKDQALRIYPKNISLIILNSELVLKKKRKKPGWFLPKKETH